MAELGDETGEAAPEETAGAGDSAAAGDSADAAGGADAPGPASTPAAPAASAVRAKAASVPASGDHDEDSGRGARKIREGLVVSDKMQSTVVVAVTERVRHARYGKTVQRTKKLYAHDDHFEARIGDRVRVAETRPISKLKRWRVTEVLERAR
jgi:small subunit ribosomal protein S17